MVLLELDTVQKVGQKQAEVTDGEGCIIKQGLGFEDHKTMLLLVTCCKMTYLS